MDTADVGCATGEPVRARADDRRRGVIRVAAVSLCGALIGIGALAAPAVGTTQLRCGPGQFTADVTRGPDRDLSFAGKLSFIVSGSGNVAGALSHYGKRLRVTGTVQGRTLTLVFHLRSGLLMTGAGHAANSIDSCAHVPKTGIATGPRGGDRGVWGYGLGG
jgi:hypothetical protein